MTDDEVRERLNELDLGEFEVRVQRESRDTLFVSAHRARPRLLVTREAKEDCPDQIADVVEDAVRLMFDYGGDVVIRVDRHDPSWIKAFRETIPPSS